MAIVQKIKKLANFVPKECRSTKKKEEEWADREEKILNEIIIMIIINSYRCRRRLVRRFRESRASWRWSIPTGKSVRSGTNWGQNFAPTGRCPKCWRRLGPPSWSSQRPWRAFAIETDRRNVRKRVWANHAVSKEPVANCHLSGGSSNRSGDGLFVSHPAQLKRQRKSLPGRITSIFLTWRWCKMISALAYSS